MYLSNLVFSVDYGNQRGEAEKEGGGEKVSGSVL